MNDGNNCVNTSGWVHLLRGPNGKYFITSSSAGKRVKQAVERFEISYNCNLDIIHLIPTSNRLRLQDELYRRFESKVRMYGWLELSADDVADIRAMDRVEYPADVPVVQGVELV